MEFIKFIQEITPWRSAKTTHIVKVTQPEEYDAFLVEFELANPRHLIDIVNKVQMLPFLTENEPGLGKVMMSFQFTGKFYIVYEFFQEASPNIDLTYILKSWKKAVNGLSRLAKEGIWHGDICIENFKRLEKHARLYGFSLPLPRTWDNNETEDPYKRDMKRLSQTLVELAGGIEAFDGLVSFYDDVKELKTIKCIYDSELDSIQTAREYIDKKVPLRTSQNENTAFNENAEIYFTKNKWIWNFSVKNLSPNKLILEFLGKGYTLCPYHDKLMVIGGLKTENQALSYNFATKEVESLADLNNPHQYHTSIVYLDQL